MSDTLPIDQLTKIAGPTPNGPAAAPPNAEQVKSLAAQFESLLLSQMMRQMRESMFDETSEEGKASGFASGPLADQLYSELSLAISRAGGVGLGQSLSGALERQTGTTDPVSSIALPAPAPDQARDVPPAVAGTKTPEPDVQRD